MSGASGADARAPPMRAMESTLGSGFVNTRVAATSSGGDGLGTLRGVYFPCLQNILGVLLFLRLPWITGQGGIWLSLAVVLISVATTIPTAFSITAIATNGRIPAGGPYYVVSRNLGAAFGGAIGFLFFLGTSLGATMYILGTTETLVTGFGISEAFPMFREVIALGIMFVLAALVYVGIEMVNKIASLFLAVVLLSIALALGGLIAFGAGAEFGSWKSDGVTLATKPALEPQFTFDEETQRTPTFQSLVALFYPSVTGIMAGSNRSGLLADPGSAIPLGTFAAIITTTIMYVVVIVMFGSLVDRQDLLDNKLVMASIAWPFKEVVTVGIMLSSIGAGLQCLVGAPQLLATMLHDEVLPFVPYLRLAGAWIRTNLCPCLRQPDEEEPVFRPARPNVSIKAEEHEEEENMAEDEDEQTTGPSTAAEEEESGDAADPESGIEMTDRSGDDDGGGEGASAGDVALSEDGASKSLTDKDGGKKGARDDDDDDDDSDRGQDLDDGTPKKDVTGIKAGFTEILVTWFLASVPCLAGNLDMITPIQTMFFLMMYLTINAASLTLTLFPTAGFRPTRPVHWSVPLFGGVMCVVVMMIVQWWQALVAFALAGGLYYWIQQGEQDESWGQWGSGLDSMQLGNAHRYLLALKDRRFTPKNWRPQLLVLVETSERGEVERKELLALAGQLKKGHGLTIGATVIEGALLSLLNEAAERAAALPAHEQLELPSEYEMVIGTRRDMLQDAVDAYGASGFAQVIASPDVVMGLNSLTQATGLGPLEPNSVLVGFPRHWDEDIAKSRSYVAFLKSALRMRRSLLVTKCDEDASSYFLDTTPHEGTIDLWWMRKDSGLILLLPYLLTRHRAWRKCKLRLFAVDRGAAGRKEDIEKYLAAVRIPAEVTVINVDAEVIDEAMAGRTLTKADRAKLRAEMGAAGVGSGADREGGFRGGGDATSLTLALGKETSHTAVTDLFPQLRQKEVTADDAIASSAGDDGDGGEERETESSFVQSAKKINAHIQKHSSSAALVIANLMLTRTVAPEQFLKYTEEFTKGIPRAVLVRGSGDEIITAIA